MTEIIVPQDIDAERIVLGAVLVNSGLWSQVRELGVDDFMAPSHQSLIRVFAAVADAGVQIDLVTVRGRLRDTEALEDVGGTAWLSGLTDGLPSITNIRDWVSRLRELRVRRDYLYRADKLRSSALAGESATELQAQASAMVRDIGALSAGGGIIRDTESVYKAAAAELDLEMAGTDTGIPCHLQAINCVLRGGGWQKGQSVYIGARPSRGKSAFLLGSALAAARAGYRVLFFSLEMPPKQLAMRHLVQEGGLDIFGLRKLRAGQEGQRAESAGRAARAFGRCMEVARARLMFSDNKRRTAARMLSEALDVQAREGLDLVVVDYLGFVHVPGKGSLYERTTDASQDLHDMAAELDVPLIIGVQLNRSPEAGGKKRRPSLADFRDSGAIEQNADIAILIHQEKTETDTLETGEVELIVAKQRNGATGIRRAYWQASSAWFFDQAPAEEWSNA
jgi:replicative DNA helicase